MFIYLHINDTIYYNIWVFQNTYFFLCKIGPLILPYRYLEYLRLLLLKLDFQRFFSIYSNVKVWSPIVTLPLTTRPKHASTQNSSFLTKSFLRICLQIFLFVFIFKISTLESWNYISYGCFFTSFSFSGLKFFEKIFTDLFFWFNM